MIPLGPFGRKQLTPPDTNPSGIVEMEWVRKIGFKRPGIVESIKKDCALVDWLKGEKELVPCTLLERCPDGEQGQRKRK